MAIYLSSDLEGLVKDIRHVTELQLHGEDGRQHSELARKIMSTVEQAEILVRTLKEFSARQETKRTAQDINGFRREKTADPGCDAVREM